jgi:ATP adenylyltransferase
MTYVASAGCADTPCVFCSALAASDDRKSLILHRAATAFLILNAYPYASGHLMAMPLRHVANLEEARPQELTECMTLLQAAVRALRVVYGPDGFNLGLNQGRVAGAGVVGHAHFHLVPRVLPESLETTYDRLRPALVKELS